MAKSSDRKKKMDVVYQYLLLIAFGVYLLITKMFLDKILASICWLLGTFIMFIAVRKLKKNELDQTEKNEINEN
jgi:positive regulator of sigma E activity